MEYKNLGSSDLMTYIRPLVQEPVPISCEKICSKLWLFDLTAQLLVANFEDCLYTFTCLCAIVLL